MRVLVVWLVFCALLLYGVAGLVAWAAGESIGVFLDRALDQNFMLGLIAAFTIVAAYVLGLLWCSRR